MRQACTDEKRLKIKESMQKTRAKRSKQVCRVFKVKIDYSKLSTKQREELKMMFVEGKWIKNDRIAWARDNEKSIFECARPHKHEIVNVKNKDGVIEQRQLQYIGSQMAQGVVDEMKSNLKTIISLSKEKKQKHGQLHFVDELKSLNLCQYGNTYKFITSKKMKIQGVSGYVMVSGAKQFINDKRIELASAKLLNTPKGYYIAISTFTFKEDLLKIPFNGKTIAIDFGCQTSLTYSDGRKQTVLVGETEHMKRLQQKLERQKKGSNNRERTKRLLRQQYQKMKNIKDDLANKILAQLKHYDNVIIQDEQLARWHKNGHGKKVQHSILGRVKSKLMTLFDNVIVLDKFIPTTKICMDCGKTYDMKPSQRTFKCTCGVKEDRDIHAAQNMVKLVEMMLGENLSVPVGRREFKREEFLEAYEKRFSKSYERRRSTKITPFKV